MKVDLEWMSRSDAATKDANSLGYFELGLVKASVGRVTYSLCAPLEVSRACSHIRWLPDGSETDSKLGMCGIRWQCGPEGPSAELVALQDIRGFAQES